jgi:hypothetical protein
VSISKLGLEGRLADDRFERVLARKRSAMKAQARTPYKRDPTTKIYYYGSWS